MNTVRGAARPERPRIGVYAFHFVSAANAAEIVRCRIDATPNEDCKTIRVRHTPTKTKNYWSTASPLIIIVIIV